MALDIPEAAVPLVLGTLLALAALTVVLSPLLSDRDDAAPPVPVKKRRAGTEPEAANSAVAALREIEFDRETGKLSDNDYADLKRRYTREALNEMRAADAVAQAGLSGAATSAVAAVAAADERGLDPVEAAIRRAQANQRSCGVCGPRSEPDAIYCSSCGRYLPGACASCGTSVDLVGSRFCSGCGEHLAAA